MIAVSGKALICRESCTKCESPGHMRFATIQGNYTLYFKIYELTK